MSISEHHAKCIEALQRIALLADTGSNEYRNRFYDTVMADVGWRVAEAMREVANDVVGDMPLSPIFAESKGWTRTVFSSFWCGANLELIVAQNGSSCENWKWTARGWRQPDECDGADGDGWVKALSRSEAEAAAIKWYMQKDE